MSKTDNRAKTSDRLHRTEQALRDSEEKSRAISDGAHDAVIMMDTEGDIVFWNPAAENIFGYPADEILGKPLHRTLAPSQHHAAFAERFKTFRRTGEGPLIGKTVELTALKKDGSEFPIELSLSAIQLKDRLHAVGIVRDITERKKAQEETSRLADVVKQAHDSILISDVSGRIEYVNPAFERLTGYRLEEIRGQNPRILKSPNRPPLAVDSKNLWETIRSGKVWQGEFLNRRKNGDDFIEDATIFPIKDPDSGEITGFGAVKSDVTQQRELTRQLQASFKEMQRLKEEAESANRLKSQFLANMSHDIRTPLNGILGFADLMMKETADETTMNRLKKITDSGTVLLALINDILDFSKIEAGQLDIYRRTFAVKELLEQVTSLFELPAREKTIRFTIDAADDIPPFIFNDRLRLHQVLSNLLSNAFKFTRKGRVTLSVSFDPAADTLVFQVKDTGPGIPAPQLESIFEPFTQVRRETEEAGRPAGAGLGLAICKNLVNLLGGHISAASQPHRGTTMTFSIAAGSARVSRPTAPPSPTPAAGKNLPENPPEPVDKTKTILIVDDNAVNREVLTEQLKSEGFRSLPTASDGNEAVRAALEYLPDLVLMDIRMPGIDGNQAVARLREKGFKKPIIALSAFAMQEDIKKSLDSGADDYMVKPIDFVHFFRKINRYLTRTSAAAPAATIKYSVSKRLRDVFLQDTHNKVNQLEALFTDRDINREVTDIKETLAQLSIISHTYKGNAAYMGLNQLQTAAADLHFWLLGEPPAQEISPRTRAFTLLLKKILAENSS